MGYSTTYQGLIADALELLDDTSPEVLALMDSFIARAEVIVQRDLDLECLKTIATLGPSVTGTREIDRGDFIAIDSLWLAAGNTPLDKRSYDWCQFYAPTVATIGEPAYWAEKDSGDIIVVPTPADGLYFTAHGVERPDGLSEETATTFLSTNAGDLLLEQVVALAETYLGHDAAVTRYMGLYSKHLAAAQIELRGLSRAAYLMMRKGPTAVRVA